MTQPQMELILPRGLMAESLIFYFLQKFEYRLILKHYNLEVDLYKFQGLAMHKKYK